MRESGLNPNLGIYFVSKKIGDYIDGPSLPIGVYDPWRPELH